MIETHLHKSRQTIKLGLVKVMKELFPGEKFKTAYSIQEGVFCKLNDSALSVREVKQIDIKLKEWVKSNSKIELVKREHGYYHYRTDGMIVQMVYPCEMDMSLIVPFTIIPYSSGFIIDFGDVGLGGDKPLIPPDLLASSYEKTQNWLDNVDIELMCDVNRYIKSGESNMLLSMAEALHEKEISDIADAVLQQRRALRVLLISGPSSAGKTSFAQRIATQLRVNGLRPVPLSLDDYFLNREFTPRDEQGNYDFESLESIDLPYMQKQVHQLIDGDTVETPIFDFVSGRRMEKTRRLHVGHDEILVIEGIHALNPNLLPTVNRNILFKIYLSALFEINIDLINRIPTTEARLLRRLV
jgi:uridine kinase